MKDKTAPEKLQGHWLLELSEMAGIKKMDVETVKSFASRVDDKYRPSYGRVVESHPRQCIIIGTTNNDGGFLRDVTGNRRSKPSREQFRGGFPYALKARFPMPYKPKRPCAYPGCGRLADSKSYCAEHQKAMDKQYNRYERDPASNKQYGRAWKRIRDKYVSEHPLCERCIREGRLIPTQEVHHKLPISQGGTHSRGNLIALCQSCHTKLHHDIGDR